MIILAKALLLLHLLLLQAIIQLKQLLLPVQLHLETRKLRLLMIFLTHVALQQVCKVIYSIMLCFSSLYLYQFLFVSCFEKFIHVEFKYLLISTFMHISNYYSVYHLSVGEVEAGLLFQLLDWKFEIYSSFVICNLHCMPLLHKRSFL